MPWSRVRQSSDGTWRRWLLPRPGSVRATGDLALPWVVADETGEPIGAVSSFLRDSLACGNSAASCRSYGHDLLRWFRSFPRSVFRGIGRGGPMSATSSCGCGPPATRRVTGAGQARPYRER